MRQLFAILLISIMGESIAQNRYPIVLVHGFMGWGKEEMGSYRYWGGKYDLEQELKNEGFEVYVASVGPVSSNWDRAVELYYQIKGGQIDFGKGHSEKFGLIQKPEGKYASSFVDNHENDLLVRLIPWH